MDRKKLRRAAENCDSLTTPNAKSNVEVKWQDVNDFINTVPSAGGVGTSLTAITAAVAQNGRIGRLITVKSIEVMGNIVLPPQAAGAAASDVCRIMLVQDKQPNGALFTVADLLQQASGVAAYIAFFELYNEKRFNVLYDKSFNVEATGGIVAATLEGNKLFRFCVPIPDELTLYRSGGGSITEVMTNSYSLVYISQGGLCTLEYNARMLFTDE